MKRFLQSVIKFVAYTAATVLILLAVLVGLFRLFLPRLPEYQEDIKGWASDAIGMQVEFSGMNARWSLSGPELEFYDAELIRPDNQKRAIAAQAVSIGISVNALLFEREFRVDRVVIRESSLEVRQLDGGGWWVQGAPVSEIPRAHEAGPQRLGDIEIIGEDIEVRFLQPGDERPRFFLVPRALVSIDKRRVAIDASVRLPEDLGRVLDVSAVQLLGGDAEKRRWDITVEADDLLLAGWSELLPEGRSRFAAGNGDVDLSLALGRGGVSAAAAAFDLGDVQFEAGEPFDLAGRAELGLSDDGWLAAAEELTVATRDHEWPESSLRAEAGLDADGRVVMLDIGATYLNLDDHALLLPMLPDDLRARLGALAPSGEVRDLVATVSDIDGERPNYSVTADLRGFGIAADGKRPGVRGFTGQLRANRAGGRLEIRSSELLLDLPAYLDEPVDVDTAAGTILWRASGDRVTVLSDSIRVTNAVLDTRVNVQLTLGGDSPEIDLASTFAISDVGAARRFIPRKVMKPKLYNWFQGALVAGSIERGTMRLNGPLDKFPFENDEGRLLVEGSARNLTFKYQPQWPAAEQADVDIVLDNTRLYSVRNRSVHAGNVAVDTRIEIANLREPVLTIRGLVTGTLETLRRFARQSPIDRFTGGNLARVALSGDASFDLDLTVPLRRARETTVTGLLRSNNGTLVVEGLDAPITDLIGDVTITRDAIVSESLGGRFLGEDVSLRIGPGQDEPYFAVATATGEVSAQAIVEELGVPLEGMIEGATTYEARVLFPRGNEDPAPPFTVRIASSLRGMALNLPEPVSKPADEPMLVRGDIRFMPGGERIETAGLADNGIAWQLGFTRPEGAWDLDRGVIMSGGGTIEPADTRGLHLRGRVGQVRLDEWLNLSRGDETKTGAAGQIRSVDLTVDNLFVIGQHLRDHQVRVDRSARDWLVQVDGDDVRGSVFVPYDLGSERAIVVEMERLRLPGDDVSPPSASALDPRTLPPVRLTAAEFILGERHFGAVEAVLSRTENGLESERLIATDESFEIVGTGRWVADEREPLGSRTYVTGSLNSSDVGATMRRLDVAQGVTGDTMGIVVDMSWGGGPRANFLEVLDGEVRLQLQNGQLEEVEPGAGRMLGLMSFVALPRRLSLDFRDVFNRGFRYDAIGGTFAIVDGVASTCDMSLEGPAANVGIVGQADLSGKLYQQGAVVSANVGNTLPIVGAVVGGPPGAAAMLIFSQIFKKPLEEVGQVYYAISGPWEAPAIDSVDSDAFVRFGQLAGCIPAEPRQE